MANAIVWLRRDLRLQDNPALNTALREGYAPVLVYIHTPEEEKPWEPGAATHAWLHYSLLNLQKNIEAIGSRLIIRRGPSMKTLEKLIDETQSEAVFWSRLYEPACIARDTKIKDQLKKRGLKVESVNAALLVEPWEVKTGSGDPYRVFTPFWKNASQVLGNIHLQDAPKKLPAPAKNITSLTVNDLNLLPKIHWDKSFWQEWQPGEQGAIDLLEAFIEGAASGYKEQRNYPDRIATSKLSPHLHFGEISPRQIVKAVQKVRWPEAAKPDITHFYSELGWREFSHHLLFHYPHTTNENLSPKFEEFAWADVDEKLLRAWQRGNTGVPIVDAGMRELWHTGWMHNRVRMIVASFLCKNLRYHWIHGARWFWDTLLDADLPNNTQGWQWTAGTGADAAPYFRIFSPLAQSEKFDAQGKYIQRWIPELAKMPVPALFAPWEQAELARRLAPDYPSKPIVDLKASREAALAAYSGPKTKRE